jgi:hypothetical protein
MYAKPKKPQGPPTPRSFKFKEQTQQRNKQTSKIVGIGKKGLQKKKKKKPAKYRSI